MSHSNFGSSDSPRRSKMRAARELLGQPRPISSATARCKATRRSRGHPRARCSRARASRAKRICSIMPNVDAANIAFNMLRKVSAAKASRSARSCWARAARAHPDAHRDRPPDRQHDRARRGRGRYGARAHHRDADGRRLRSDRMAANHPRTYSISTVLVAATCLTLGTDYQSCLNDRLGSKADVGLTNLGWPVSQHELGGRIGGNRWRNRRPGQAM